ncbi:serine hydrolase domain-containing protein [Streptomyces paromomycinus]|uniref:Serine hydrolase n=1 Tax=Streptomyces paromomycinus TaxID=92743 RepID=A0A401VU44_STREY|nr:serine hydrolase domain-containing protein [Streptomyces paromomycinus]GCD40600.1 serine hydrolase [Streptomyces paromomycinus]
MTRPLLASLLATAIGVTALPAHAAPVDGASATGSSGRERILRHLDDLTRSGAVGAQVQVTDANGTWTARAGTARTDGGAPVPREGLFRAGSATKMFTAVVLLQLVGEGKVSLDAPLERYVSKELVPAAGDITVRMLLQHTSGLHDVARDLPQGAELVRTRFRHYDTATSVREAAARPAVFPPGTDYGYSNTNYLVAGLIIERVTGCSYAEEVKRRIITPLRLRGTSVPGDTSSVPGPHAHGYLTLRGTGDRPGRVRQVDVTELNPSMAGPAGEIVSTTRDLDTFLTSLTSGKLLRPAEWTEMNRTVSAGGPGSRYGLGLKQERLSCGRLAVGHTGGIPGYATLAFTTPDRSRRVVLSANLADWPADPSIGNPIDKVLDDAVCG